MAIVEITALITATKAALDLAKGVKSLKNEVERNERVSSLLETLLSVQMQALEVQRQAQALDIENHEIKKKLLEVEDWAKTEDKYELTKLGDGAFVYAYKRTDDSGEIEHNLCTTCFSNKKKSVLQIRILNNGTHYKCLPCNDVIIDESQKAPSSPQRGPSSRKGSGYVKRW